MDKTTVTKDSVSESEENSQAQPDGEGKSQDIKEIENRVRENLRAEYARKEREWTEKLEAKSERLQELEEKERLSQAEKREKERLETQVDGLEEELRILETDPKYRAYNEKIKRSVAKAREEAIHEMSVEQVKEFIEEKAEEYKMTPKEFAKELDGVYKDGRYSNLTPYARTKKLFKDWKNERSIAEEREALRKEKEKYNSHSETSGKPATFTSYAEAKKSGSFVDRLKALNVYNRD